MKMNFRQRNNFSSGNRNKKRSTFLSVLFVLFLIFILTFYGPKNFIFGIASPFWNLKTFIYYFIDDNAKLLSSKISLIQENENLKTQIEKDKRDMVLKDVLSAENDGLKTALNRKDLNKKSILSAILVKPSLSPYDTLIIDVGNDQNISVGDKVAADGNTFIGYVSEVYNNTSKVILYSSPGEKVNVLIGNSNVEKEAIGMGGGNFEVSVPKEVDIKEGDSIVIPSVSTNVFGIVDHLEYESADAFQRVLFKSPVNVSELKWVFVIPQIQNKK